MTRVGYNARGSLASITYPSATGSSITYAYDQALNMTNENKTAPGQPTGTGYETWAYNANELKAAEYRNGSSLDVWLVQRAGSASFEGSSP
ncbi:MAG: hypothetical protein ACYDEY_13065 [Acidimicrobiales bacterium]